jgi:hypothetical protein
MPLYYRSDDKPVVEFDPRLELSPFTLFRQLREGADLRLIDVRARPSGWTFAGAEPYPGDDWQPSDERQVLLFDDDGTEAVTLARQLLDQGYSSVRALFGGLALYEFSLDPAVVGEETFLVRVDTGSA